MVAFQLWETQSHNLMADFDTEAQVLAAVAEAICTNGASYVDSIMLVRVGPQGGLTRIAVGPELAARALATNGMPRSVPA